MSVNGDFAAGNLKVTAVDVQPTAENQRRTRNGKFTLGQLRATDAIVPLQYGTNQFDSQKGKTAFGAPRLTRTKVDFEDSAATTGESRRWHVDERTSANDQIIRLQSGTNAYDSQKGMTAFGNPRDVHGKHLKRIWELEFPDEANNFNQIPVNSQQASPR